MTGTPDEPASGDRPDAAGGEPFDPYRFGKPEHPIPPEYAPPGYVPEPPPAPLPPHPYYGPSPYASIPPPGYPANYPPANYPPADYPPPGYPPPYGPGYPAGPPPYQPPPGPPQRSSGMAVASMTLGIVSIVASIFAFLDVVPVILAVTFGLIVLNTHRPGRGMAIAGLACAAVGAAIAIAVTVHVNSVVNKCGGWGSSGDPGFSKCFQDNF